MLAALPFAVACGGVVETSHEPGESTSKSTNGTSGASGKSDKSGKSTDDPDADTDLGSCEFGPKENYGSDKPCAWVADGLCYDTREMACNCACPRSHNSQCVSGFESGPNGHVWVACN
jgi:hypothetical protein